MRRSPFRRLIVVTSPAIPQIVAASAPAIDMPVERSPIGFGQGLAEICTEKPLDATEYHLGWHRFEVGVKPGEIPSQVKRRETPCTIFQQVPPDGRTIVRTRPNRGLGEHDEPTTTSCVLKPARQRHAVIRQLREMRGRWLASDLDIDDSKAQPLVIGVNTTQATGWGEDPTTYFRCRRRYLENIWPELIEAEGSTAHNGRAVLQISEIVSLTKTVGDGVLGFQDELVRRQPMSYGRKWVTAREGGGVSWE